MGRTKHIRPKENGERHRMRPAKVSDQKKDKPDNGTPKSEKTNITVSVPHKVRTMVYDLMAAYSRCPEMRQGDGTGVSGIIESAIRAEHERLIRYEMEDK